MAQQYTHKHRVEFADTDAAGLAHFTAFFRWMEVTEHAFYRSLGGTAFERTEEREYGVPRVSASCEFSSPVGFGDELDVHLKVLVKTRNKIEYEFVFCMHRDGTEAARGNMTVVSAARTSRAGRFKATPFPDALLHAIEEGQ